MGLSIPAKLGGLVSSQTPPLNSPSPKVRTLITVMPVATFFSLGWWQLRRHSGRNRDLREAVEQRERPPVQGADLQAAAPYRRVELSGTWRGSPVLVVSEGSTGGAGAHILQSFVLEDGVVAVDRGFVPEGREEEAVLRLTAGADHITGQLRPLRPSADCAAQQDFLGSGLNLWPPGCLAAAITSLPGAPTRWLVQGEESKHRPTGPPPWPGWTPATRNVTSRNYAIQWFLFATAAAVTGWRWVRAH